MGDKAFTRAAKALVTVQNGKVTTVQVGTTPVDMSGIISGITEIRVSGSAVQVLKTEKLTTEPSGTEINYIKLFSFQLPSSAQPNGLSGITYVPVQFKVPGTPMGDTLMGARLRLNWSTAVKTDDGQVYVPNVPVKPEGTALDVTDPKTEIKVHADKGVFNEKVTLIVDPITKGEKHYDEAAKVIMSVGEKFRIYDVHFENEKGVEVQPSGKVTVYYPIPDDFDAKHLAVYRINEDGTKTKINGKVEDGYYKVVQKSFSIYAVVETDSSTEDKDETRVAEPTETPETTTQSGHGVSMFALVGVLVAGAVIAILVIVKKRNSEN